MSSPSAPQKPEVSKSVKGHSMPSSRTSLKMLWYWYLQYLRWYKCHGKVLWIRHCSSLWYLHYLGWYQYHSKELLIRYYGSR